LINNKFYSFTTSDSSIFTTFLSHTCPKYANFTPNKYISTPSIPKNKEIYKGVNNELDTELYKVNVPKNFMLS
jgi:hypothetical protein